MKKKKHSIVNRQWFLSDKKLTLKKLFSKNNCTYAFIWAIAVTILSYFNPLEESNRVLEDMLYHEPHAVDGEIVLFGIDEKTLNILGDFNAWAKDGIADALNMLNVVPQNAPAVIAIDCMFPDHTDFETDKKLVNAAALMDNDIFSSTAFFDTLYYIDKEGKRKVNNLYVSKYQVAYPELFDVTTSAHSNIIKDSDSIVRSYIHELELSPNTQKDTGLKSSMSLAAVVVKKYHEYFGVDYKTQPTYEPRPPLNNQNMFEIPYHAEVGTYGDTYSLIDLINGSIEEDVYAGKIVLIGSYSTTIQDAYLNPISAEPMHAIEIHANTIDAMRSNEYYYRASWHVQMLVLFSMIFLLYFVFYALTSTLATIVMLFINGGYILLCRILIYPPDFLCNTIENPFLFVIHESSVRIMLTPLYIVLSITILFFVVVGKNVLETLRVKNQISGMFKKYIDPRIVEKMSEKGFTLDNLSSQRITACVLFVDIRGFTPFSEPLEPMKVVEMLRDYLTLTSTAVLKHKGFIDKFIGDATMAVFNAPLPQADFAYKAVLAGWDISYNGSLKVPSQIEQYGRSVMPGIGITKGPIIFGNIGSDMRKDLTAIGDTVNTAARFESVARRGQVLINESLYESIKDKVIVRYHGKLELKGKSIQPRTYALEQIVEYIGKYPPLASASVPPGKDSLKKEYNFETAPRLFPSNFTNEQMESHIAEVQALTEQLEIEYRTKPAIELRKNNR